MPEMLLWGQKASESDLGGEEYDSVPRSVRQGSVCLRACSLQEINFDLQGVKGTVALTTSSCGDRNKRGKRRRELRCWDKFRWLASFVLLNSSSCFFLLFLFFLLSLVLFLPFFLFFQHLHLWSTYYLLGVVLNTWHIYHFIWLVGFFSG